METKISKLIEEAKQRGFVKGVKYENTSGSIHIAKHEAVFFYYYSGKQGITLRCGDGQGLIYEYGKWAKIISYKEEIKDSIVESVVNQFKERSEVGIKKYNTTLDRTDLSTLDWINHAQQEAMDFVLYLEKLKKEYAVKN